MESGDGSGFRGTSTEPLIDKIEPAKFSQPIVSVSETEEDRNQYLQISYNYDRRTIKDVPFALLFCLMVACTFGFGIFASINRNPHRFQVSDFEFNATSSACSFVQDFPVLLDSIASNRTRPTFSTFKTSNLLNSSESFWEICVWTLIITLTLSAPLVLFHLFLLQRYTKQLVYVSLPLFLILPIFINVYWFIACTLSSKCSGALPLTYRIVVLVLVFMLVGVVVWIFVVSWHIIELTVNVIGLASNALLRNLGLLGVLPTLTLGLLVYFIPIILFLIYANRNGKIVPEKRSEVFHCVWRQDGWVPAYYALAILTMLWSATAMVEAQIYVISGTIAQWYFSPDGTRPKHGMRSSLRNAFGTSFGTICISGLLICVVKAVRFVVDSGSQEGSGFLNRVLRFCANSLLSGVDFLNKFTINMAAVTGEAYCKASKMTYDLLIRNLVSAVGVETVSARVLSGIILVSSSAYGIVVCALLKGAMRVGDEAAYLVALMAWGSLMVVLAYVVLVLENAIDTIYICYAVDRDRGEVCRRDVHQVCDQLPIRRNPRAAAAAAAFVA